MQRLLTQWSSRLSSLIWRLLGRLEGSNTVTCCRFIGCCILCGRRRKRKGTGNPSGTLRHVQSLVRVLNRSDAASNREQLKRDYRTRSHEPGGSIFLPSIAGTSSIRNALIIWRENLPGKAMLPFSTAPMPMTM